MPTCASSGAAQRTYLKKKSARKRNRCEKKSVRKEIARVRLLPGAAPLNLVQPRRSNIGREVSQKRLGSVWDVPLPRKCQGRV